METNDSSAITQRDSRIRDSSVQTRVMGRCAGTLSNVDPARTLRVHNDKLRTIGASHISAPPIPPTGHDRPHFVRHIVSFALRAPYAICRSTGAPWTDRWPRRHAVVPRRRPATGALSAFEMLAYADAARRACYLTAELRPDCMVCNQCCPERAQARLMDQLRCCRSTSDGLWPAPQGVRAAVAGARAAAARGRGRGSRGPTSRDGAGARARGSVKGTAWL